MSNRRGQINTTHQQLLERIQPKRPPALPDIPHDERRFARRKASNSTGFICSDILPNPVSCMIRDMSATGARLQVSRTGANPTASTGGVPETFTLMLRFDRVEVDCQVMWRKDNELGVRFTAASRPCPPPRPAPSIQRTITIRK